MRQLAPDSRAAPATSHLGGALAEAAFATLDSISHDVMTPGRARTRDPWLEGGAAGLALLHRTLDPIFPERGHAARGHRLLRLATRAALQGLGASRTAFLHGPAGVSWCWLIPGADLDEEPEARLLHRRVDEAIAEAALSWTGPFGVVDGLAGLALHALERLPEATAELALERVVAALERSARPAGGGLVWPASPGGAGGIAEGTAGVLAALARIAARGILRRRAERLARGAARWLGAAFVPVGELAGQRDPTWSDGAAGLAAAFALAGRLLDEPSWEARARGIGRSLADREGDLAPSMPPGFANGAAGVAHVLARLHVQSRDPMLAEGANRWLVRALARRELDVLNERRGHRDPGFLNGAAGLGMVLAAALVGRSGGWDRAVLVSAPEESR